MNACVGILFAVFTVAGSLTLMPSGWTVVNPLAQSNDGLAMSLLYCRWSTSAFTSCPRDGHSFSGVANFNFSGATVSGNHLHIPFTTNYLLDPVCWFEFESSSSHPYMHSLNSEEGGLHVYLWDVQKGSGSNVNYVHKNWSGVSMYITATCLGAMSIYSSESDGNIPQEQEKPGKNYPRNGTEAGH